jgi:thiamine pyrophosphate-dependent acetolactate synthase large subunit-like protein
VKSEADRVGGLRSKLLDFYLTQHVDKMFACEFEDMEPGKAGVRSADFNKNQVPKAIEKIAASQKPALVIGSQAMLHPAKIEKLTVAVETLGIPVYLAGMARGLMGRSHPLLMRHQRKKALKNADLVILAGMPCDFRLNYGRSFGSETKIISVNRSKHDLRLNCRPDLAVLSDPFLFLCALAEVFNSQTSDWESWAQELKNNDDEREALIQKTSGEATQFIHPLVLLQKLNEVIADQSIIVGDGGDFVASAAYILQPRGPLSWLDPGVFGTLGVGAGFALASKLIRPDSEVWLIYGDGAAGFSLVEFDTLVRHKVPVIAVVGNDAGWSQIARDQVAILGDDVATVLRRSDYHLVAEGLGAKGFLVDRQEDTEHVFKAAKQAAKEGHPVLINALIGKTDFRKGSISV